MLAGKACGPPDLHTQADLTPSLQRQRCHSRGDSRDTSDPLSGPSGGRPAPRLFRKLELPFPRPREGPSLLPAFSLATWGENEVPVSPTAAGAAPGPSPVPPATLRPPATRSSELRTYPCSEHRVLTTRAKKPRGTQVPHCPGPRLQPRWTAGVLWALVSLLAFRGASSSRGL